MAGENQYINPIIEAMVNTAHLQQNSQDLAEKTRQAKAEEAFRQSQLAQQEGQFEKSHELAQRQADVASQHMKALIEGMHVQNIGALHGLAAGGVDIGSLFGGPSTGGEGPTSSQEATPQIPTVLNPNAGTGKVNIPGLGLVDPKSFGSPDQQADIVRKEAHAQAQGVEEVKGPGEDKKLAAEFTRTVTLHNIDAARNEKVEQMRAANNIQVAQIRAAATRAALAAGLTDPDSVANAYAGILNGQTSFSTLPKELKAGVVKLAGERGSSLPTNQKQYSDSLNTVSGIEDLVRQYQDLALNYSRDAEGSNILYRLPLVSGTKIPYTDLKSKSDALKAQGGALASFFDKQNRKSDAEILRQFDGLFDPKSTIKQNMDKLNSHLTGVQKAIKGTFSGINPDDVNMILQNRGITEIGPIGASSKDKDPLGIR